MIGTRADGDPGSRAAIGSATAPAGAISRRTLLGRTVAVTGGLVASGLAGTATPAAAGWSRASAYSAEVPAAWFDLAFELVRTTPGFSPPVASRALGYAGVALYEAIAPGTPGRGSLVGRLRGVDHACWPQPRDGSYHWPTVANSALATILRSLFPTAPPSGIEAIAAREQRFAAPARATLAPGVFRRSVRRGTAVAADVFEWSIGDGGHEGFARNFPATYVPPAGPGLWVPTPPAFQRAMQPFWGANRTFALSHGADCAPPAPPRYSEIPGSLFHRETVECYEAVLRITPEQEVIARFWSDDPGVTATPAGHSLSILNQLAVERGLALDSAAEAYAGVGIAVADAFIACWRTKYEHNVVRPVSSIRALIDPTWSPLLVTPPFAEYTSGHSVQSAAAAQVMTDLFGRHVAFTDRTHERRGLPARSFGSFEAAAEEAAISRLYGGIHFRSAIENGLRQGGCIGRRASQLLGRGHRAGAEHDCWR